jgi:hypothetical protein
MIEEKTISDTVESVETHDGEKEIGITVQTPKKSPARKKAAGKKKTGSKTNKKTAKNRAKAVAGAIALQAKYPRHTLTKALRIPSAVLEQNAGKECSDKEAAAFVGANLNGPMGVEISSALKYGFLERPTSGHVKVTELARKILRPQQPNDEIEGLRAAVLKAPDISDVYKHYRGENLPDPQFFDNALVDTFHIPEAKLSEFKRIFIDVLNEAKLLEDHNSKLRVLDVSLDRTSPAVATDTLKKLGKAVSINADDSCFVIMPFAPPLGNYYEQIYEPAIQMAGLNAVRADADIFATGKIMDQVWRGLTNAKVLVAELTSRNPNVFYELGLAHAMKKPVVLISSNEDDVPFDVRHIRVIYYDVNDPFWGEKLMKKVSENILSALKNPEEAIFDGPADL